MTAKKHRPILQLQTSCTYQIVYIYYLICGPYTKKKSLVKGISKIPLHIRKHYELWKRIVELEGPQGLRAIKGYHDEALKGKWYGFRSSRLSLQWRVIYKTENEQLEVYVIDINPHEY